MSDFDGLLDSAAKKGKFILYFPGRLGVGGRLPKPVNTRSL